MDDGQPPSSALATLGPGSTVDQRTRARVRRRAAALNRTVTVRSAIPPSRLENKAAGLTSVKDYARRLSKLWEFADRNGLGCEVATVQGTDPIKADTMLTRYLDHMYLDGAHSSEGLKLVSAWKHFFPEYARDNGRKLPRTARALKGWARSDPPRSRVPLPLEWAMGLIDLMLKDKQPQAALLMALVFDLYCRPCEAIELRKEDIVPP